MKFYEVNNTENYQISNDKNTIGEYKKYAIMLKKTFKMITRSFNHQHMPWICRLTSDMLMTRS